MRRYDVITEICDAMLALGWEPYQNDHEDANGQFEMNWDYDDCLTTADRHAFFKYMVKSMAEKHGLRATFMPKPFMRPDRQWLPRPRLGLGQERQDQPVPRREGRARPLASWPMTSSAASCISAEALCAFFNPTVNSYKRINAPAHHLGRHLVAQHDHLRRQQPHPHGAHPRRRPLRAAARWTAPPTPTCCRPACSPPASTASPTSRDPGKRLDINMYTEGHTVKDAPQTAAQPPRRAPRPGALRGRSRRLRRRARRRLLQAQARRVEPLLRRRHAVGARDDAGLLTLGRRGSRPPRHPAIEPRGDGRRS